MTEITEFKIVDYPLYVSVEQQLRNDAHELVQRAQIYITQKKLDCVIGCLDKAMKKIKRADMLKLSPLDEAMFGSLMNKLCIKINKQIMEGK